MADVPIPVLPQQVPKLASPWVITISKVNTPVKLFSANLKRGSFCIANRNFFNTLFFAYQYPLPDSGGGFCGCPIFPGDTYTLLSVYTLQQDVWVWYQTGIAIGAGSIAQDGSGNWVLTITSMAAGVFTIGQVLTGAGIPAGTTITANGTGYSAGGGAGTYYLSTGAAVGPIAVTGSIFPINAFGYEYNVPDAAAW